MPHAPQAEVGSAEQLRGTHVDSPPMSEASPSVAAFVAVEASPEEGPTGRASCLSGLSAVSRIQYCYLHRCCRQRHLLAGLMHALLLSLHSVKVPLPLRQDGQPRSTTWARAFQQLGPGQGSGPCCQ
mmetsp:Transcript_25012/g.71263  ORF Transcript_25012/g.71263 Transcript_25012/m.71263 type:complete len:127 (+) Transcript_25012:2-382(+)